MKQTIQTRISNLQFFMMIIGAITPFGHFIYVHLAILSAGRDAWLSLLLGSVLGCLIIAAHFHLGMKHSDNSLIEYSMIIWGKYIGRIFGCLYMIYFLLVSSITIHVLTIFTGEFFHNTPGIVFLLTTLLLVTWGLFLGLEVIARLFDFLLPILMLFGILVSVLILPDKDPMNLLPILDDGIHPVWQGSLVFISMFCEWIVFGMISQHVNEPKRLFKQGLIGVGVLTVMFLGPVTGPILLFSVEMAKAQSFPTFEEVRYIAVSDFLERLDLLGLFLWLIGSFLRISVFTWGAMKGFVQLFHLKNERLAIYLIILLVGGISYSLRSLNVNVTNLYLTKYYLPLSLMIGFAIPLLTILVDRLFPKRT